MSSRLIVKNLPQKCSEQRLKEMFSSCGEVTDVKLMKTPTGTFRKFGFIGFSTDQEAEAALKHFNKTYVASSRIEVELAKPYGDQSLAKPWSKYSFVNTKREGLEEERVVEEEKKSKLGQMLKEYEELEADPTFQEFLHVHKHKTKVKTWSDVTIPMEKGCDNCTCTEKKDLEAEREEFSTDLQTENSVAMSRDTSDLDYLKTKVVKSGCGTKLPLESSVDSEKDINIQPESNSPTPNVGPQTLPTTPYTVKMLGLPFSARKKDIKTFFHPLKVVAVRFTKDSQGRPSGRGYVDFLSEEELSKALKRNRDCIFHRYIELFRDESAQDEEKKVEKKVKKEKKLKPWELKATLGENCQPESVIESGRIFVRNLPFTTEEEQLNELFGKYGPLTELTIPLDKVTNKPMGIGFVTFMLPEHAAKAYQELDGQIFQGRLLHLLPAHTKSIHREINSQQKSSFKRKKEMKILSEAGSSHNWNSLFLGANAVVDVMAKKYSTKKSVILESSSGGSAAVRMALGETQIVNETRDFLHANGVNLEVFEQTKPTRSKTVIIVKNLQSGTTDQELSKLFQPFGQLLKVVMPPAGISALVEFSETSHAKKAFKKLAYTNFKHLPLYLEWAPLNVFEKSVSKTELVEENLSKGEETDVKTSSVFIKNINFSTKEESLHDLFSTVGEVQLVTIAKKLNPKDPAKPLSMGFGFVEYVNEDGASLAIKELQNRVLDGHKLELKLSQRKTKSSSVVLTARKSSKPTEQKSSKILVRNIPFEANRKEIKDLFCTFGAIKTVRLPKKMSAGSGEHRGFGFIEFITKEAAKRAFDSLSHSTHLYGRRLVLEWAEQEESLEAIRKRTAEHFHGFKVPTSKRSKSEEQTLINTLDNTI